MSGCDHEDMGAEYQVLDMARLNETLKKHGIADKGLRQRICSDYIFSSAYFLGAGWFEHGDKRLYPQLCFAERKEDPDANLGEVEILHIPAEGYDLHDYALGNADRYFEDDGEDTSQIKTGSFQLQDEPDA